MPCYGQFVNGFSVVLAVVLVRVQGLKHKEGLSLVAARLFWLQVWVLKALLNAVIRVMNVS